MAEKDTPRTLIQGFLDIASTNQGIIQSRRKRPVPRTPKVLPSHQNKTFPNSQQLSGVKKRAQSYQDEATPRHLIESYVATNKTVLPAQQRKKRRRSSVAAPLVFDPIADNYTPRTNIQGFLQQAIEETPVERQIKRNSGSDLPEIPSNKSIHISHDFSSNIDDDQELADVSGRRKTRRSLTNKSSVQQFTQGVQKLRGPSSASKSNNTVEYAKRRKSLQISGDLPEIPLNKSINIEFSDIEDDDESEHILTPSKRKSVAHVLYNKPSVQQFSQGIHQLSQKDPHEDLDRSVEENVNLDDGEMADDESDNDSTASGGSGFSPRKSTRLNSSHLSPDSQSKLSKQTPAVSKTGITVVADSDNDMSPVIAEQAYSGQISNTVRNSARVSINSSLSDGKQVNESRKNLISPLVTGPSSEISKLETVARRSLSYSPENSPRQSKTDKRRSQTSNLSLEGEKSLSPRNTPKSALSRRSGINKESEMSEYIDDASKMLSPRSATSRGPPSKISQKPSDKLLSSPSRSSEKLPTCPASPEQSQRETVPDRSVILMEKSKRTVTEVLMDRSRRGSTSQFSPLANKVMRKSVGGQSPVVKNQSPRQSMAEFSPKLSSTRKSLAGVDKSPRKSVSVFSPKLSSTRKSLAVDKSLHASTEIEPRTKDDELAAGDWNPDVNEEDVDDEETASFENTSNRYKLKTPHLQSYRDRPSPQLSDVRIPLKESNRKSPKVAKASAQKSVGKPKRSKNTAKTSLPVSITKAIFTHFCKMKVAKDAIPEIVKVSEKFWQQIATDIESYAAHAGRKTIDESDVELLMKRQRFVTEKQSLNVLVEKHLPLELRQEIIPIARSGNKVTPL